MLIGFNISFVRFNLSLTFILICFSLLSQKLGSRSCYEKRWAVFHPFAALKVKCIYKRCMPLYLEARKHPALDTISNGGKLDAFRHAFFMAAFSQKIKARKVRKLGIAHEKGNYRDFLKGIKEEGEIPDSLSTVMDLFNNELGIKIGRENKKLELAELKNKVMEEIKSGKALYFKRDAHGYLSCSGERIPPGDYTGKWYIPKCLIATNK